MQLNRPLTCECVLQLKKMVGISIPEKKNRLKLFFIFRAKSWFDILDVAITCHHFNETSREVITRKLLVSFRKFGGMYFPFLDTDVNTASKTAKRPWFGSGV